MDKVRAAAVQATPVFLHRDETVEKAVRLIREAAAEGAGLVVFPETFIPTYPDWVWRAGVWDEITEAMAAPDEAAVQMIDTSVVRVHQHGACIAGNREQHMGRSRGGLTNKVHAVVDANGLPLRLASLPARLMIIGSARRFWPDWVREQWSWRIVATMPTGSERSSTSRGLGPIYPRR